MKNMAPVLPTPHLDKLKALTHNPRLPAADKPKVDKAFRRCKKWIGDLQNVTAEEKNAVERLVEATNLSDS